MSLPTKQLHSPVVSKQMPCPLQTICLFADFVRQFEATYGQSSWQHDGESVVALFPSQVHLSPISHIPFPQTPVLVTSFIEETFASTTS